jgi:long-chain acyl-CoA synthetase
MPVSHKALLTRTFLEQVKRHADRMVFQAKTETGYETYSYQQVGQKAQMVADILRHQSIQPNDRVAILLENCPEWGIIYFGILLAKATAVPIDPQATPEELEFYLTDSDSVAMITSKTFHVNLYPDDMFAGTPQSIFPSIQLYVLKAHKKNTDTKTDKNADADPIASLLYTSGTTAQPKGVPLTHKNLYANFQSIQKLKLLDESHNLISVLPLHHTFPFMVNLLIPLFAGCVITYPASVNPTDLLSCMQETGVTVLVGVPLLFERFYPHIQTQIQRKSLLSRFFFTVLITLCSIVRHYFKINLAKWFFKPIHRPFGKKLRFFVNSQTPLHRDSPV